MAMEADKKYPLDLGDEIRPLDLMGVEAKRVGQCKICQIGDSNPHFLHYIYTLKFDMNFSLDRIVDPANDYLKHRENETGRQFPPIYKSNLTRHLKNHVPIDRRRQYEMQKAFGTVGMQTRIDNAPEISKEYIEKNKTSGLNLFEELNDIYAEYKKRYDRAIEKRGDGDIEFFAISEEMRKILVDLNKMKQNEKLVGIIVKQLMHNHTEALIRILLHEVDKTDMALSSFLDDSKKRSLIIDGLKNRIGESLTHLATDSVEKIAKQYPITGLLVH